MSKSYVALIRKEDNTEYWIDIPDVPGCASCGETIDAAIANFEDALQFHLQGMKESGVFLQDPRSVQDVLRSEEDPFIESYMVEIDDMTPHLKFSFSRLSIP